MPKSLKALLFWVHRWLGIAMCLLFALWFASGVIMMYVEYPELGERERLAQLPELDHEAIELTPFEAASTISSVAAFSSAKLTSILDRPAYELADQNGRRYFVFADTGEPISNVGEGAAVQAARLSGLAAADSAPSYDGLIDMDQWSISSSHNVYRPLHRIAMNDSSDSVLYVSDRSAQIVLETTGSERLWNWLGSTIHWIYPLQLRRNASLWTDVIVYSSLLGIFSVITGGIIGFMRIRVRAPYRSGSSSPYKGWMKWHHVLGLLSLVFVSTFIFSGLMSMGPWGVFSSSASPFPQMTRYYGNDTLRLSRLPMPSEFVAGVKEIEWHQLQSNYYYSLISAPDVRQIRFEESSDQNASTKLSSWITAATPNLLPQAKLISMELISSEDNYYYSRRGSYRPLPVYRAIFDDADATWYHIDLSDGEIINRVTSASRRERWLFNGLHSLDFQFLLRHRPLWDIVMLFLSLVGLVFSITAIIVGWRRLVR